MISRVRQIIGASVKIYFDVLREGFGNSDELGNPGDNSAETALRAIEYNQRWNAERESYRDKISQEVRMPAVVEGLAYTAAILTPVAGLVGGIVGLCALGK